ncbi:DUF4232 domain-containing protein [Agromyces bauzanensis]
MRRILAGPGLTMTALVVLLTGCTGGTAPSTPPATSAPASPSATPTTTPTSGPVDPNAPAGQCADDALQVTISAPDSGAGSSYYELSFTNTGGASCELRGAPGVSVVDASGTQLGEAADQVNDDAPPTLTLEPGASVTATLQATNIEPDGGPLTNCPVVHGTAYLVYPPHSFTGVLVETGEPVPACESDTVFLHVEPVQQAG